MWKQQLESNILIQDTSHWNHPVPALPYTEGVGSRAGRGQWEMGNGENFGRMAFIMPAHGDQNPEGSDWKAQKVSGWLSGICSFEKTGSKPTMCTGMWRWGKPEAQGCVKVGHGLGSYYQCSSEHTARRDGGWQKVEARSWISLSECSGGHLEGPPLWCVLLLVPTPLWNLLVSLPQVLQAADPVCRVPGLGRV